MGKVVIGLDLGIASVGYSVLLVENGVVSLLERGSHLFPILSSDKTITSPGGYGEGLRGQQRRARRTIQRRKQRRIDFSRLINDYEVNGEVRKAEYSYIFNFDAEEVKNISYPIYELAVDGLKRELNPKELFKVLYSKLSFRGVSYNLPHEDFEKPLANELLDFLNKNKKVRTPSARIDENNDLLKFSLTRNSLDIEKIIDNCSYLRNTNFKKDYLEIFKRVRDYSLGAGSQNSRTDFGVYKKTKNESGELVTLKSVWEESIGKCPVYEKEYRSLKCQALPEIANLISQLNSIKYKLDDQILYLTEDEKKQVVIDVMKNFKSPTPTRISSSITKIGKNIMYGYPKSKDGTKANIEKCENLIRLFKNNVLLFKNWEQTIIEIKNTDEIFSDVLINFYNKDEIVNANKDYKKSIEQVKKADVNQIINSYENFCCLNPVKNSNKTDDKIIESLANFQKNNISGTHTFSLSAIFDYINKNIDSQKTLSTFYHKEINEFQLKEYRFNKWSNYINNRLMDNVEFISPNVKNAMSETCKIFNNILKKYIYNGPKYLLDALVIETTSDSKYALNGLENNKKLIKNQTDNETKIKNIKKQHPSIKESTIEKLILLSEQDGMDLYDGKPINGEYVIDHPDKFEIDHILPISRTQMNDRSNKVLTKSFNNQEKGNKTPIEWLSSKSNFKDLKVIWKTKLEKEYPQKLKYMLLENLTTDREKSFIARNLTETQYIMRRIKNGFLAWQSFIAKNNTLLNIRQQIGNMEVLTISGSVTQRLRSNNYLNFVKDRDISAEHHNIDASICAFLGTIPEFRNTIKSFVRKINNETGEITWASNEFKPKDIFSSFVVPKETWTDFHDLLINSGWKLSYKYMTKLDKYNNIDDKIKALNPQKPPLNSSKNSKEWKDWNNWKAKKISGETIYGWVDNHGDKHKKKRITLLNLKPNDFGFLNEQFQKTHEESVCLNSKNYFVALQKIWLKYYDLDKQTNPFIIYMENNGDDEEFKIAKQINHVKLLDGKLNSSITKMTFIGSKVTIGLGLSKISQNAYMSNLNTKCVYIIKDNSNQKISFFKKDWLNTGEKYEQNNNLEVINIIEIGTIYEINNELFRVSGFDISGNKLELSPIHGNNPKIRKSYSSFEKIKSKIKNKITVLPN